MLQSKCSDLPFKLFGKMIAVLDSTLTSPDENPNKETNEKSSPHQEESLVVDPRPDEVQEIMLLEKSNGWELKTPTDQNVEETLEANEYMPMGKKSNCNKVVLRKPDKLLPCPRCDSGETKFCYYNNYNVNQPRHFCKNCQRYWTAGGTLRNVPVGAGRRKNKHSTLPHVNHINFDPPQSVTPSFSVPSPMTSSVISFGLEQCNDAAQALFKNPVISSAVESNSNLVCGPPNKICTTNRDAEMETRETKTKEIPPNRDGNWWINASSPWASYSCNGAWSTSVNASSERSLGKHARCSQLQSERSLLLPRTLRINDGKEGSESSIWKSVRVETKCGSGVFKAFQRSDRVESTDNKHICATSSTAHFMNANPAAHTRSGKCLEILNP